MNAARRLLARCLPSLSYWVKEARHKFQTDMSDSRSLAEVFGEIYEHNLWGGQDGEFYSGSGSDPTVADGFVALVREYVHANGITSIVDLGCGDFRVGSMLVGEGIEYVGADVVPDLVQANQQKFGGAHVRFELCDIVAGPLPAGQLYILRQVLQHLSNYQIGQVLTNLDGCEHVLIAEHQPGQKRLRACNIDKTAGKGTRIGFRSGVFPDKPPFSRPYEVLGTTSVGVIAAPDERITIYAKRAFPS